MEDDGRRRYEEPRRPVRQRLGKDRKDAAKLQELKGAPFGISRTKTTTGMRPCSRIRLRYMPLAMTVEATAARTGVLGWDKGFFG
eukprot:s18_g16.t1